MLTYDVVDDFVNKRTPFRAAHLHVAEHFATNDPYVKSGIVKTWKVRPWAVVVGEDPAETRPLIP